MTGYNNCPPAASHTCGECNRVVPPPAEDTDTLRAELSRVLALNAPTTHADVLLWNAVAVALSPPARDEGSET